MIPILLRAMTPATSNVVGVVGQFILASTKVPTLASLTPLPLRRLPRLAQETQVFISSFPSPR